MSKNKKKTLLGRIWRFIWEEDSIWSWLVNIVLAFVLIKFIVYPGLGFLFGTTHPVVAVVSGSMEHAYAPRVNPYTGNYILNQDGKLIYYFCTEEHYKDKSFFNFKNFRNFDDFWDICGSWYENYNITKDDFKTYNFKNGFNTGDIIVLFGRKPEKVKTGDVIVFRGNRPDPIIHRVVKKWDSDGKYYFQTKGDHNSDSDISESSITEERLIGKAVFRIPLLGYIKIWFVDILKFIGIYKYVPI
ncbi:signal peptidase I [Candidatus Woesearchaeota archaeon]|nr:signal peptidase I [Candidatus Woesearchaeota archaeon]